MAAVWFHSSSGVFLFDFFKEIKVGLLYTVQVSIGLQRTPGVPRWGISACASCVHTRRRAAQQRSQICTQGSDRQNTYNTFIEHDQLRK
jgi:hypothetical protein